MQVETPQMVQIRCLASTIAGSGISFYHKEEGPMPVGEALRHAKARHVEILEDVPIEWKQWAVEKLDYRVPPRPQDEDQPDAKPKRRGRPPKTTTPELRDTPVNKETDE